jgi:hypothetical protein
MSSPKILVTGGPVHGYLDAVKIITNRFKGGMMAAIADDLNRTAEVIYLTVKGTRIPGDCCQVLYHDGIDDYMEQVLKLAPECDAVVLGAAVANLVPANSLKGKFPSHNYKEGDEFPIMFKIAPRVVNYVKKVAPKTKLFAFKLLSGVPHEELINAAHDIAIDSHAEAVFANDATDLEHKYAVTKEKSIIPMTLMDVATFIMDRVGEKHYSTEIYDWSGEDNSEEVGKAVLNMASLVGLYGALMHPVGKDDYVFGSLAARINGTNSFVTTTRGKKDLSDVALVKAVLEADHMVFASQKATLNAPLLDHVFKSLPNCEMIVHLHTFDESLPTLPYATPGTSGDTNREIKGAFNIEHHGIILPLDENFMVIKEQS